MMVLRQVVICTAFLSITLCCFHHVLGAELIGVLPFSNQRYQEQGDWLGYYIQARIQANLKNNSDWRFYPQNVLSLWSLRTDQSLPVSPQTTILIEGSFQQVAGFGYISLQISRCNTKEKQQDKLETTFETDHLDHAIDELSALVGRWIDPKFLLREPAGFPVLDSDLTQPLLNLRKRLFRNEGMPEIRSILFLEEKVSESSPYQVICDLAELMLISSQLLENREQKLVYSRVESLLRKAILKNRKQPRLYLLLAEVYYLNGSYAAWVEKTADDAIQLGDVSGLGYLLKELVAGPENARDSQNIDRLNEVNPWLLSGKVDSAEMFQQGLLKEELLQLKQRKGQTN